MKQHFKTHTTHSQRIAKRDELELKTGVRWGFWSTAGGTSYAPIIRKGDLPTTDGTDANAVETAFLAALHKAHFKVGFGLTFVNLAEATGLPLEKVMIACNYLVQTEQTFWPVVNRMGDFYAIRPRNEQLANELAHRMEAA